MSDKLNYTELLKALDAGNTEGKAMPSAELDTYKSVWDCAPHYTYADSSTESCWQKLKANLTANSPAPVYELKRSKPVFRISYLKWAAVVILSVGLGLMTTRLMRQEPAIAATTTYQTQRGQTKVIALADGSDITLNAGSVLTIEKGFNGSERKVSFTGEAFFDIAKNPAKPFVITNKDACVTVLGTSFNLESYPESNVLRVALKTGKVRMSDGSSFMDIVPGETGYYNHLTHEFSKTVMNADRELDWLSDKMVFENEKLSTIISELERKYAVTFSYNKVLDSEKLTVTFHNQTLDQVVSVLEKTMGTSFSYTKN